MMTDNEDDIPQELRDPEFLVSGLPSDLILDMLHALTHAVELNLDKVLKPSSGQLTPHQEEVLECFKASVAAHRDRCRKQCISEEMYDQLGLEGPRRNGVNALLASIHMNMQRAQAGAYAQQEEQEAMAEKHFQNLKPEDLN